MAMNPANGNNTSYPSNRQEMIERLREIFDRGELAGSSTCSIEQLPNESLLGLLKIHAGEMSATPFTVEQREFFEGIGAEDLDADVE